MIRQLRRYVDAGYEIVGGLHVSGSPACDPDTGNWITDLLDAAAEAGIEIRQIWQIPPTSTGEFDPADPNVDFGDPASRQTFPEDAVTVTPEQRLRARTTLVCGARIPVRQVVSS